jgi:DNA-directed RNA polymerase subunit RPC12/RpoP
MMQQVQETKKIKPAQYLGVQCQYCGQPIPVPARVTRQITAQDDTNAAGRYLSTLLNLRCRACHTEYFYDVREVSQLQGAPHPFASHTRHERPLTR